MQRFRRSLLAWLALAGLAATLLAPASASADATTTWTPGPGAVGDNTYDGYIDIPRASSTVPNGGFLVGGWFVDKTAEGWAGADDVQAFLGTMDGGKMLARGIVAQNRPDVGTALGNPFWAASGFSVSIPAGALNAGAQMLSVYMHTPGKGWWYKQTPINVSSSAQASAAPAASTAPAPTVSGAALPVVAIEKPIEGEKVLTKNQYEIIGYALDPNATGKQGVAGSGVDRVQVYMDKERENGGTYLGDATLGYEDGVAASRYGGQFATAGWRLTFKPTQFHVNTHMLFAYARSAVSGKEDLALRFFAIADNK